MMKNKCESQKEGTLLSFDKTANYAIVAELTHLNHKRQASISDTLIGQAGEKINSLLDFVIALTEI